MIRYADDFVVTAATKELAEKAKNIIQIFLQERGLELSEEKTTITHIEQGFDFLGWNFRKYKGKLLIKPSNKSIKKVTTTIGRVIKENIGATQDNLIHRLNQIISGWSNYHQPVVARKAFEEIDNDTFWKLWRWACKRHPNKSRQWIRNRYWKTEGKRHWVFKDNQKLRLMTDTKIIRHIPLKLDKNSYIDQGYFKKRKLDLETRKLTGKIKKLWIHQQGICPQCKLDLDDCEDRKLVMIPTPSTPEKEVKALLHKSCTTTFTRHITGNLITKGCF